MIDHASKHLDPALTPQILLKSANLIKEIVWVSPRKTTKHNPEIGYARRVGGLSKTSVAVLGRSGRRTPTGLLKTLGNLGNFHVLNIPASAATGTEKVRAVKRRAHVVALRLACPGTGGVTR